MDSLPLALLGLRDGSTTPRLARFRMSLPGFAMKPSQVKSLLAPVSCWRLIKPSPSNLWVSSTSRASAVRWRLTMCWLPQFPNRTDVRFSNRPVGVKRFQALQYSDGNVARGLVLLYGLGTS